VTTVGCVRPIPADAGDALGCRDQRPQRRVRLDILACRIGLEALEVDAQGRAFGARTGEAKDDARAVVEADADALPGRDRRAS
jgi:hypothetical protein